MIGCYPDRVSAEVALAEYNKQPYDPKDRRRLFSKVFASSFTLEELGLLWEHKEVPFVDTVLIYCYSGWRVNELARMPLDDIDLEAKTFTGGLKNRYSRNRTVPIHSAVYEMACGRPDPRFKSLNMIF